MSATITQGHPEWFCQWCYDKGQREQSKEGAWPHLAYCPNNPNPRASMHPEDRHKLELEDKDYHIAALTRELEAAKARTEAEIERGRSWCTEFIAMRHDRDAALTEVAKLRGLPWTPSPMQYEEWKASAIAKPKTRTLKTFKGSCISPHHPVLT